MHARLGALSSFRCIPIPPQFCPVNISAHTAGKVVPDEKYGQRATHLARFVIAYTKQKLQIFSHIKILSKNFTEGSNASNQKAALISIAISHQRIISQSQRLQNDCLLSLCARISKSNCPRGHADKYICLFCAIFSSIVGIFASLYFYYISNYIAITQAYYLAIILPLHFIRFYPYWPYETQRMAEKAEDVAAGVSVGARGVCCRRFS
jgi:hypothetical protein